MLRRYVYVQIRKRSSQHWNSRILRGQCYGNKRFAPRGIMMANNQWPPKWKVFLCVLLVDIVMLWVEDL